MTNFTQQIIANPEGGTVSLTADQLPTTGYFVGGLVSPLILEPDYSPGEVRAQLDIFIEYVNGPTVGAPFLGWWTDEETGKVWVDATSWHGYLEQAGREAWERREIAFWGIAESKEYRVLYAPEEQV